MIIDRRELLVTAAAITFAPVVSWAANLRENTLQENSVFELRQYTLRGHQRDELIALFEQQFIEPQETLGAHVVGMFRDLDDPDRFVWLRAFADMPARKDALTAFYGGPVWKAHRAVANATMIDSDNVLLLKPILSGVAPAVVKVAGGRHEPLYGARIYALGDLNAGNFAKYFAGTLLPRITQSGGRPIATFVTESSPNNFPALPVRGDRVFVWIARWPTLAAEQHFEDSWHRVSGWRDSLPEALLPALMRKPERLRLVPTAHSALK